MAKFNVGDRVRRVRFDNGGARVIKVGYEGRVVGFGFGSKSTWPYLEGFEKTLNDPQYLELVEPASQSPIRTVTRREIVPGMYGIVEVGAIGTSGSKVAISIEYGFTESLQLREAARLFNEIADVLDENEKKDAA